MTIPADSAHLLTIDDRTLGEGQDVFVIAEIGVNHDGDLPTALRLVDAACEAGADAVKLQLFRASRLLHAAAPLAQYQRDAGAADAAAMLRRYELPEPAVARVVEAIRAAGMVPLATPFSPEDVEQVAQLGLPAVKLASPDLVNPILTDAAAALGLPMLLSTGAATEAEIDWAVRRLRAAGAGFALLHCVSAYPTPAEAAGLAWIRRLAARHGVVAGYSDHTQVTGAGALAVAAGARIIEKHLTHDRAAPGPDHSASADPRQFRDYVRAIREAEAMLGAGEQRLHPVELDVRHVSRQSLVTRRPIRAGEPIARADLTCQRPGTGIPVQHVDRVVGMKAGRDIPAGAMLDWFDLAQGAQAA